MLTAMISCGHNNHDISLHYQENGRFYSMKASFPENRTKDVEAYMDDKIGNENKISFENTRFDANLTLDDNTQFYINKAPGILTIKLDKDKNSDRSYREIKVMCDGIKKVLAN